MDINPDELISIEEEIELLKKYISIEKARHEEQIEVEWLIEKSETNLLIPAMLLQPILENTVKHGFIKLNRVLRVVIEIDKTNQFVLVRNDGNPLPKKFIDGIGLQTVKQLLKYHFSDSAKFSLYQEDEWVVAKISF